MSKTSPHYFLNIEHSAMGRSWRMRLDPAGEAQALAMVQRYGIGDISARILAGRGVALDKALTYLDPTLRDLMPDPSTLRDMDAAVARLAMAISNQETVAIFGDYDVDGACSAALLASFLDHCATKRIIHIPDRIFEGYGPNAEAVSALAAQGATLLVTVDCGTTSHTVLEQARETGLDTIVLDHHQAAEILPQALVVNPNRQDDLSGLGQLCAAGVVFMTLVGLNRHLRNQGFWTQQKLAPDLLAELDLVALATIADVAPLTGLNRAFVIKGLAVMRQRTRTGLSALMDAARLSGPPQAWHLGFLLGPRINAGGRIGDAGLGTRLLLNSDPSEAARIAADLNRLNEERRVVEAATVAVAEAEAEGALGDEGAASTIVTAGDDWHPGVVGLVASRLKERFNKPAFAIAFSGPVGTGSGRSIPGVDLGAAVRGAVDSGIVIKGGGHAMAAGITIQRENLGPFRAYLEQKLTTRVTSARADNALLIDAALSAGGATRELVAAVALAGPYGSGNPEPLFALPRHRLLSAQRIGTDHMRLQCAGPDGTRIEPVAFRALKSDLGPAIEAMVGSQVHLIVTLSLDYYGGRERVQARLVDIARAE